jgi:hypothetical protein
MLTAQKNAYAILARNKQLVSQDTKAKYQQKKRTKYESVINAIIVNF